MERPEWDDHVDVDPPLYPAAPIPLHERTWRHPSELGATSHFVPPPAQELNRGVLIAASVVGLMCVIGLALVLLPSDPPSDPSVGTDAVAARSGSPSLTLMSAAAEVWSGIECTDSDEGVVVAQVAEASPAAVSGLVPGDVIVAVDGEEVTTVAAMHARFGRSGAGAAVDLTVMRSGAPLTMVLELAPPP